MMLRISVDLAWPVTDQTTLVLGGWGKTEQTLSELT